MFAEERDDLSQEPEGSRPADEETPAALPGEPGEATPAEGGEPQPERRPRRSTGGADASEEEVIPGMHLEPDLVLEEAASEEPEFGQYVEDETYAEAETPAEPGPEPPTE